MSLKNATKLENVVGPEMLRLGCITPHPIYCFSQETGNVSEDGRFEVEFCDEVLELQDDSEIVQFKQLPEVPLALCMKVYGANDKLETNRIQLLAEITQRGYHIVGAPRYNYVEGAWNQKNPQKWLTIIQVPVEKVNENSVDLIIDDTPEAITVSCFEPVRREIARQTLERLIQDGRIHPTRVEEMYEKCKREVELTIKQTGEKAVIDAGVNSVSGELVKLLGKLKYRTSYGQNVLNHSLEVSYLSGLMAAEVGADVKLARRAGLLHDIGKAVDHQQEGSHIELGVEYAKKYKENDIILNAIEAHHGDVEPKSIIACLVQAADAISAARPGARRENLQNYIKRLEKLEEISNSFEGVERSFAIQAGREVRIMVKPEIVNDDKMVLLARDVAKKIEESMEYPGQIKVSVIRETRHIDYAK